MGLFVPPHRNLGLAHIIKRLLLGKHPLDARTAVLLHLALLPRPRRVIARRVTAVRNMEPPIDPQRRVHDDNNQLKREIEDVEARLAMVPSRTLPGTERLDIRARAERGAETEQHGCEQEDGDFGAEAAGAELVEAGPSRDDEAAQDEENGEEGDEGVEDLAVELHVAVDAAGVGVEGEEGLHGAGDEHDQGDDDDGVDGLEGGGEGPVPADVRVGGAHDALGEDQVDDEEEDGAGGDEDLGGDGDADVGRPRRPDDAEDAGRYARHAEAEHEA